MLVLDIKNKIKILFVFEILVKKDLKLLIFELLNRDSLN